jgi:hypothetical protein
LVVQEFPATLIRYQLVGLVERMRLVHGVRKYLIRVGDRWFRQPDLGDPTINRGPTMAREE